MGSLIGLLFLYPYDYWSLVAIGTVIVIILISNSRELEIRVGMKIDSRSSSLSLRVDDLRGNDGSDVIARRDDEAISKDRHGLRPRDDGWKAVVFIICFLGSFIIANVQVKNFYTAQSNLLKQGQFSGEVRVPPDLFDTSQRVRLSLENNYRLEVYLPLLPIISRGDKITLNCFSISPPKYYWYAVSHKILGRCENPKVSDPSTLLGMTGGGNWGRVLSYADGARIFLLERLGDYVPEPLSGFIGGLLFGTVAGIPEPVTQNLQVSGLSAILAVSGYNVTMIFFALGWLWVCFFKLPYKWGVPFMMLALSVYVLMVGFQVSVIRAAVMAMLWLILTVLGRLRVQLLALLYALAFFVLINPAGLFGDWGLWLSFSATAGILFWPRYIMPYFSRLHLKKEPTGIIVYLAGAQLGVYPVLFGLVNQVPVFGGIALMIISITLPALMLIGVIVMVTSFLPWSVVPMLFGKMAALGGAVALSIARLASELPNIVLSPIWGIALAGFCILAEIYLWLKIKKNKTESLELPL